MQPPDVDKKEQKLIINRGFKDFLEPPDETGLNWIKRKKDDSCWFLTKDNKCQIYDVRPAVCRLEPFTIVDFDYETNTVELEPNFPFSECCIGFNENVKTVNLEDLTKAVQVLIGKIMDLTAQDLELPVTDKQVLAETRSRLLRRSVEVADLNL
jgi:Fe-S-cluster containining protein